MVVYKGQRRLKDLVKFVDKEMEKAKKERVQVKYLYPSATEDFLV